MAATWPKNGTVAEPGFVSIAPGNGARTIEPVSVCLTQERVHRLLLAVGNEKNEPVSVYDGALFLPNVLIVPIPSFRVDWLSDAAEDAKSAQVVTLNVVCPKTAEEADGSGRRIKLRELVGLYGLPVSRRCRVHRRRFKHGSGNAVAKRPVDDVSVDGIYTYYPMMEED
jgi:hypothetical protein